MKNWALAITLVGFLVALAFILRGRYQLPKTPEAAVSKFFEAAGRGDDVAYLSLTSDALRRSLEETRSRLGPEAFRDQLRRSAAGIKGLAVTLREDAPPGFKAVDVEIVFIDRNERQRMLLLEKRGGWSISSIGEARRIEPPIPYGTPVFETEEQGAEKARSP